MWSATWAERTIFVVPIVSDVLVPCMLTRLHGDPCVHSTVGCCLVIVTNHRLMAQRAVDGEINDCSGGGGAASLEPHAP